MWSHAGIICTGETYKNVVKMTFAKGASLEDPSGLFNSSLEGNTRRAIDFHEGDKIDEEALKALIRAAVALNTSVRADRWSRPLTEVTKERLRSVEKPVEWGARKRGKARRPWSKSATRGPISLEDALLRPELVERTAPGERQCLLAVIRIVIHLDGRVLEIGDVERRPDRQ